MKPLQDCAGSNYQDYLDFEIVDQNDRNLGTLYSMWSDQGTGRFEFLGFKTGWLMGKNHIMPVTGVEVDEEKKIIRVPYTAEFLKDAPSFDATEGITEEQEASIRAHYKDAGGGG